jgi:hypothetical protein
MTDTPQAPDETKPASDNKSGRNDPPTVQHQMTFSTGERSDGTTLEPQEQNAPTTLDQYGVGIDHRGQHRESCRERAEASSLMVDDRPQASKEDPVEQTRLAPDVDETQQTLDGDHAVNQFTFEPGST